MSRPLLLIWSHAEHCVGPTPRRTLSFALVAAPSCSTAIPVKRAKSVFVTADLADSGQACRRVPRKPTQSIRAVAAGSLLEYDIYARLHHLRQARRIPIR